jgi:hypothetical protein
MAKGNPHRTRAKRGRPADPNRAAALQTGAIRYQGPECHKGHTGTRYASTGACVACYGVSEYQDCFADIWA